MIIQALFRLISIAFCVVVPVLLSVGLYVSLVMP